MDSILAIVFPLLLKFALDAIANKSMDNLLTITFWFALIITGLMILTPLFQYLFGKTVKSIMIDFRLFVYQHLERLPVSYFENTHSGDSISRVNSDLGGVETALTENLRLILSLVMTGVYSAIVMFYLDWRFSLALIVMGIFSIYLNARFAKPLRAISTAIQESTAKQMERLMDSIAGTHVSRIFQASEVMINKYKETNEWLAKLSISRSKRNATLNSTNFLLMWINNGGVFIFGSLMIIEGLVTVGTLFSLILLLDHVTNVFRHLGSFWANLQSSLAGATRVFELLDTDLEPERLTSIDDNHDDVRAGMIDFREASFSYVDGESTLNGVSFNVKRGDLVALVGPSGGGKSTIVKLILGFYQLREGEIAVDGKRIDHYSLDELRDQIAYVSQDGYLFEGTIEENIRYGQTNATFEEIVEAATAAYAHDFIMEQVDGYKTLVGERGARLSGGQRQRITIARALLKNAPILLLDEATSALDSESEQAVQQGLERLMIGKTTMAIAHRLSTIKQADMILVIDKGSIVEQGTHEELLQIGGVYSRLHVMQDKKNELQHLAN